MSQPVFLLFLLLRIIRGSDASNRFDPGRGCGATAQIVTLVPARHVLDQVPCGLHQSTSTKTAFAELQDGKEKGFKGKKQAKNETQKWL